MSTLTHLARALPRLPEGVPQSIVLAHFDGTPNATHGGKDVLVCEAGDGRFMLATWEAPDEWTEHFKPLTPLLSRDEIAALAEGALTDARVRTWPLLTNCLALGVLLADVPRAEPESIADARPPDPPLPTAPAGAAAVPEPAEAVG